MIEQFKKWGELGVKDRISYIVAFVLMGSGIIIAFLSFFLNAYNIATGVLIYIAQCFVVSGGLVGANVYFRSKWIEFNTQANNFIKQEIEKVKEQD